MGLHPSRMLSWLITSVIVGWAIVYNILRIAGRSPRSAAWVGLLIGLGVGALIFIATVVIWRRVVNGARYRAAHMNEIPPASRLDARQRTAIDALWPAVGVLALAALAAGGVLLTSYLGESGGRSLVRVVISVWDLLVGVWLLIETQALRHHDGDAVEAVGTSALLTAVLAGVAVSMNQSTGLQAGLIVVATITAILAYFTGWRLLGSRGVPFAAVGALIVGGLSLILPLIG